MEVLFKSLHNVLEPILKSFNIFQLITAGTPLNVGLQPA